MAMAGAAALLLAGCGTVSGSPVSVNAQNELFEPCDVPKDSLLAADVKPAIVTSEFLDGQSRTEWDVCTWAGRWYFLSVLSTTYTFEDIQKNPINSDFAKVAVGERDAVSYFSKTFIVGEMCDVAFPWAHGSAIVRINTMASETPLEDPCLVAVRTANTLDPVLPR